MKKLLLLLTVVTSLVSCSLDDDRGPFYHYEILAVENFEVPDTFDYLGVHEIKLFCKLPSNCHSYSGIYFDRHLNERTIAVQSTVLNSTECVPNDEYELYEVTFNFQVINTETYLFKFYKGQDENGDNIFEEVEIPVNSD